MSLLFSTVLLMSTGWLAWIESNVLTLTSKPLSLLQLVLDLHPRSTGSPLDFLSISADG